MIQLIICFFFLISGAVEIQRVIIDFDIEDFLNGFFDGLNSRIAELHDLSSICEDHVVVLPIEIRFFVLCLIFSKLVLPN